jgi:outer membrane protein OmpA-like peptidoglycan-associated protein
MIRSDELEFELEDGSEYEFEDELEYGRLGPVPGPLRIRIVYERTRPGSREFEYEDEADLFDPVEPPKGATQLTRFAFGRATLTADHRRIIAQLARDMLPRLPSQWGHCLDVVLVGHEDEVGDPARFGALGQQRAKAVATALESQLKRLVARLPAASRPTGRVSLIVRTAGPRLPRRSNVTAQGRALNRRVEVLVGRPDTCPDVT